MLTKKQWSYYIMILPVSLPLFILGFTVSIVINSFMNGFGARFSFHNWLERQ